MGDLKNQERAAIEAVARQFSATLVERGARSDAHVAVAGKRVALEIAAMKKPRSYGGRAKPRLRFDKVAVGLVAHLQATLRELVPDSVTVLLTVTAPIRLPSKTAAALEDKIRVLLERRSDHINEKGVIQGNHIQIRIAEGGSRRAPKVIGFVHNPDTDPKLLLDMAAATLKLFYVRGNRGAPKRSAGDRWLVVMNLGESSLVDAYRYVYSQLRSAGNFERILMVFGDGRVETLVETLKE